MRPAPDDLHDEATRAGTAAAEAITPTPMGLSDGTRSWVEPEGAIGFAAVVISPPSDPLAAWLLETRSARRSGRRVRMAISWPTQSMERAMAFARSYVDCVERYGVRAHYEAHVD